MIKDKLFCLFCLGTHYNQYECVYDVNDVYYRGWSYHLISLCMYVCIYIYVCMYMYAHLCTYVYIYICVCVLCIYACVCIHVPSCTYGTCTHVYIYIYTYVCMHTFCFISDMEVGAGRRRKGLVELRPKPSKGKERMA